MVDVRCSTFIIKRGSIPFLAIQRRQQFQQFPGGIPQVQAQQAGNGTQDFDAGSGMLVADLVKTLARQGKQGRIGSCFDRGGPRAVGDNGHFPDGAARRRDGDFLFDPAVIQFQYVESTGDDEADFVARITFAEDDFTGFKPRYLHVPADRIQFIGIQIGEDGDAGQAVDNGFLQYVFRAGCIQRSSILSMQIVGWPVLRKIKKRSPVILIQTGYPKKAPDVKYLLRPGCQKRLALSPKVI